MKKSKIYPTYFAFGALLLYGALCVLPSAMGMGYSFTDWSVRTQNNVKFVGLANFERIFDGNRNYLLFLGNTLLFTFVTTIAKNILGLAFALILTGKIKVRNFHRAVMYIPAVLSALIVGYIFRSILNPESGLLNSFLRLIGIEGPRWLSDPNIAFWSVMGVDVWKGMGYIMTIFIAGIVSISPIYYEAAQIDGADWWQQFRIITLPLLMPTITVTTVLNVLYGLKVFDMVFALTNGGPGYTTEVLYTGIYREFGYGNYAVSTALSSLMFVFMVMVGVYLIRLMTRNEVTE